MKSKDNKATLIECDDPMLYLSTAIVHSGVVARDDKFFRSNWAKTIFDGLGIETDPLEWYNRVRAKKEALKHGDRCS